MKKLTAEIFHHHTPDGIRLSGKYWIPSNAPHGIVCLIHGFGEHQDRYAYLAKQFTERGIALITYDQRGHGISEGKRGHIKSYDLLLDDLEAILDKSRSVFTDVPLVLYGHSFGGNVLLNFLIRRRPKGILGAVVTSPWLKLAFEPPVWKVKMAKIANKLMPRFTEHSNLDATELSHDVSVVQAYKNDPLVHGKISARMFVNVLEAGEYALSNASNLSTPVLMVHGEADKITAAAASKAFAKDAGAMVSLKIWDGLKHETHNEPQKDEVIAYNIDWIEGLWTSVTIK